ncbi:hypothetical protein SH501x_000885 [Pirellulaceae bacterium SH501]
MYTEYVLYQTDPTPNKSSSPSLGVFHMNVAVCTVAKLCANNDYFLFNEAVAVELGIALGIPITHGVIISNVKVDWPGVPAKYSQFWASLKLGENPAPIDFAEAATDHESSLCGILVFDAWIGNDDRHDENVYHVPDRKLLMAFDHERAICGDQGSRRLENLGDGIDFISDHPVAPIVKDLTNIVYWLHSLSTIPESRVISAVYEKRQLLPDRDDWKKIATSLIRRQRLLTNSFHKKHKNENLFSNVEPGVIQIPEVSPGIARHLPVEIDCNDPQHNYSI